MSPASVDDATAGERLRALRLWRHMTLEEVADQVGVTAAYLSMAERGLRSIERRSLISGLAAALRVSETELTGGPHLGINQEQHAPHTAIPALRIALQSNLTAALAAAALRKPDVARGWLSNASRLASRVRDDPDSNWQSFSATNVGVWRVAVGVELGETGGAIREMAGQVSIDRLGARSSRRADFFADVARGLSRDSKCRVEAAGWLRRAERAAPQRVRNSSSAGDTVLHLLRTAKGQSVARELRGMAARMGIPH
jgi:transcriptional regulator with XRE-family HTH domain